MRTAARRTILTVPAVLAATALAACGGGGGSGGGNGSGAGTGGGAGGAAKAAQLIKQTFGVNDKASSGQISATVDIAVTGVRSFKDPISLTTSGPFSTSAGSALEDSDLTLGLELHGGAYGAGLTTSGDKVYVNLGSTAYQIPSKIVGSMRKAAAGADNGISRVLAPFSIGPQRWAHNPTVVGDDTVAGEKVVHLTAGIDAKRFFIDAGRFTRLLTRLKVTGVTGLPKAIGPAAQAALVRSVKSSKGDVYTGVTDHVLRRAQLAMSLAVAPADRKVLGGIKTATVKATLDVTEVGQPQTIKVQADKRPYKEAADLLQAIADQVRAQAKKAK